ncbi:MAG: alanine racemase [Rhodospirillales bacterium]|nr:alanine racemase [Rhodospirillales bacterium]
MRDLRRDATTQVPITHPTWKEVDLDTVRANYREIARLAGPRKIIASVKANAYGHGIVEVSRAIADLGVYALATGSFEDAVAVRDAGITAKIQMFAGGLPAGMKDLLRYDLMPTVYNMESARAVSEAATKPARVYVKVDAGLGRLGVPLAEAEGLIRSVAALPRIEVEGVYTHLPYSDAAGQAWSVERLKGFHELIAALERAGLRIPITQAVASAAVASGVPDSCTAVCSGHLLFGGHAVVTDDVADLSAFRPVLRAIKTKIIHVGRQAGGRGALSGGKFVPQTDITTGVVAVGLFDGYRPPAPGKKAFMLFRGRRVPVLGVSLEYTVLDLSTLEAPAIGEEVLLLGDSGDESVTLGDISGWQGMSRLEVLMSFDRRLPCRYTGGTAKQAADIRAAG